MRIRAVALLIQNDSIAVMERHRGGRHYFTFPGGGVDAGEAVERAVVREVEEELGIQVRVMRQVATRARRVRAGNRSRRRPASR